MSKSHERTAAEREAARRERERKRAARRGAVADPPPAPPPPEALPEPPPEALPEPPPAAPPEPPPEALPEPPPAALPEPPPEALPEPPPAAPPEPPPAASSEPPPAALPEPPEPVLEPHEPVEPPAPAIRLLRSLRVPHRPLRPRVPHRPLRPRVPHRPRRRPGATPARHSRASRAIAVLVLVLAVVVIWLLAELYQPFHGSGHGSVTVTIPPHSSSGQVGDLLAREGVIGSSFFFQLRATLDGERSALHAGTYRLKLDMSYGSVLDILTTPPPPAKVSEVTIVEGRTRSQIDAMLRRQGVRGSYLAATRHSRLLDPRSFGAPRSTPSLEGFLFPSTYQLRDPIAIPALVTDQLRTFRQRFQTVDLRYARGKRLTPYDVLTIASMVQGEARTARELPLVASVIYNRLAAGMALQIDATTRYATGNFTRPLTASQLSSPSPYNTRVHKGLPPTPIDNPGLAAIQAAAHPARTSYLYFVVKPCGNGQQLFASTYAQFLADAKRYQAARAQRGGRSPTRC